MTDRKYKLKTTKRELKKGTWGTICMRQYWVNSRWNNFLRTVYCLVVMKEVRGTVVIILYVRVYVKATAYNAAFPRN